MKFKITENTLGINYYSEGIDVVDVAKAVASYLGDKILSAIDEGDSVHLVHNGLKGPFGRAVASVSKKGVKKGEFIVSVNDDQWSIGTEVYFFSSNNPIATQGWVANNDGSLYFDPAKPVMDTIGDKMKAEELTRSAIERNEFSPYHCFRCWEHIEESCYSHHRVKDGLLVCSACSTEAEVDEAIAFYPDGYQSCQILNH